MKITTGVHAFVNLCFVQLSTFSYLRYLYPYTYKYMLTRYGGIFLRQKKKEKEYNIKRK